MDEEFEWLKRADTSFFMPCDFGLFEGEEVAKGTRGSHESNSPTL